MGHILRTTFITFLMEISVLSSFVRALIKLLNIKTGKKTRTLSVIRPSGSNFKWEINYANYSLF